MQPMTAVCLTLALITLVPVSAYKKGPPVDEHPDICGSMSPKEGHIVDPEKRPLPFALTIVSTPSECYAHNKPVTVKLATTNNRTYFEGFLVQARLADSLKNNQPLQFAGLVLEGTFDTNADPQLQTLSCGNSTNNALGHREAKHYFMKTFRWTPSRTSVAPIQFVATVVHEKDEYWTGVTSPVLERCVSSASSIYVFTTTLVMVVCATSGLMI